MVSRQHLSTRQCAIPRSPARIKTGGPAPCRARQRGAFAIMAAPLLIVLILMCGMALDSGMLYNRHIELSGMARAVAIAAARELDGSKEGITAAQAAAKTTAERFKAQYRLAIVWDNEAIKFGTTPSRSGTWLSGSAVTDASALRYVKVDTTGLDKKVTEVQTLFMRIFSDKVHTVVMNDSAIAGRAGLDIVPIAICAMSDNPATERKHPGLADSELVEYGFRRGVSYDLMQLNPKGTSPARYVVNPIASPDTAGQPFNTAILAPFVCVGTTWLPRLSDGFLRVSRLPDTAPLDALFASLNSRFDTYTGTKCHHSAAPPDLNIKSYPYDKTSGARWMVPATGLAAALPTTERGLRETVADIPSPGSALPGITAGSYGPLWSYAKAAKYASYKEGEREPIDGYANFATDDWSKLYVAGLSATNYPKTYPYSTPYDPGVGIGGNTVASPNSARKEFATSSRRVLHVPLLSCSAGLPSGPNSSATLAAIGKFFMTVPASKDSLIGEFAGAAPMSSITGPVEVFP